jgi:hypothetical protein
MEAIRIKTRVGSETLVIPVPKEMIGKEVEIIILFEPEDDLPQPKRKTS